MGQRYYFAFFSLCSDNILQFLFPDRSIQCGLFLQTMAFFSSVILPRFLANRRIGENESMKTCTILGMAVGTYRLAEQCTKKTGRKTALFPSYCAVTNAKNLQSSYNPSADISTALRDLGISGFWIHMPRLILHTIQALFLLVFVLRESLRRKSHPGKTH